MRNCSNNHYRHVAYWPVIARIALIGGAVFLTGFMADEVTGQSLTDPHGVFSEDTRYCLLCHAMHQAPGDKLQRLMPEAAVCFTCHNGSGSNYNTQAQMNLDPANNAMHPIMVDLPQNQGEYNYTSNTTAGIAPPGSYACSQCHNPHGETGFVSHLKANYLVNEYVTYTGSPDPYAACWSCHSASIIVNDETFFTKHREHVIGEQSSCTACHYSPHGVAHTELVKFNPSFVTRSSSNQGPVFLDGGVNKGSCTLACHGVDHNNWNY